jgi:hypothetical protein
MDLGGPKTCGSGSGTLKITQKECSTLPLCECKINQFS